MSDDTDYALSLIFIKVVLYCYEILLLEQFYLNLVLGEVFLGSLNMWCFNVITIIRSSRRDRSGAVYDCIPERLWV